MEEGIELFVVGLPRNLDGSEGPSARRARQFAVQLARGSHIRVELMDERWTTREALARLRAQGIDARRARSKVDSAAAAIVLQAWLDGKQSSFGESPILHGTDDP
jgi:putative Holliday junction resolvase